MFCLGSPVLLRKCVLWFERNQHICRYVGLCLYKYMSERVLNFASFWCHSLHWLPLMKRQKDRLSLISLAHIKWTTRPVFASQTTTFLKLTPSNVPCFSNCFFFFFASSLYLFLTTLPSLQKMNVLSCYTVCVWGRLREVNRWCKQLMENKRCSAVA